MSFIETTCDVNYGKFLFDRNYFFGQMINLGKNILGLFGTKTATNVDYRRIWSGPNVPFVIIVITTLVNNRTFLHSNTKLIL